MTGFKAHCNVCCENHKQDHITFSSTITAGDKSFTLFESNMVSCPCMCHCDLGNCRCSSD